MAFILNKVTQAMYYNRNGSVTLLQSNSLFDNEERDGNYFTCCTVFCRLFIFKAYLSHQKDYKFTWVECKKPFYSSVARSKIGTESYLTLLEKKSSENQQPFWKVMVYILPFHNYEGSKIIPLMCSVWMEKLLKFVITWLSIKVKHWIS